MTQIKQPYYTVLHTCVDKKTITYEGEEILFILMHSVYISEEGPMENTWFDFNVIPLSLCVFVNVVFPLLSFLVKEEKTYV